MKKCEICGSYIITREDMEAMRNAHKEPGQHGDPVGEPGISISASGQWIRVSTIKNLDRVYWKCSVCGNETDLPNYTKANYCFNCGAKMGKE